MNNFNYITTEYYLKNSNFKVIPQTLKLQHLTQEMVSQYSPLFSTNKKNIYDLWYPLHTIYKFVGTFTFSLDVKDNMVIAKSKWIDKIILLLGILLDLVCFFNIVFGDLYIQTDVKLLNIGNKCFFILCGLFTFILRINTHLKRNDIAALGNLLQIVDDEVKRL